MHICTMMKELKPIPSRNQTQWQIPKLNGSLPNLWKQRHSTHAWFTVLGMVALEMFLFLVEGCIQKETLVIGESGTHQNYHGSKKTVDPTSA